MAEAVFLDYDQEELDRQYNPRDWVPEMPQIVEQYRAESERARERLEVRRDVRYDPAPGALLDIFPARAPDAPILMFIHGGRWQILSKEESAFAAIPFVEAGAAYVAVNFDLIGDVSLDEMVRQNREAIAWVWRNAGEMNGDPAKLYVSGHSSGGHLTGMMATTDWRAACGLAHSPLAGAVCASGLYDLDPVMKTFRSDYLKLGEAGARRNSPIRHVGNIACPVIVAYGEQESDEFRRQGDAFADAVAATGHDCEKIAVSGKNHFNVILTMGDADALLGAAVRRQMGLGG